MRSALLFYRAHRLLGGSCWFRGHDWEMIPQHHGGILVTRLRQCRRCWKIG